MPILEKKQLFRPAKKWNSNFLQLPNLFRSVQAVREPTAGRRRLATPAGAALEAVPFLGPRSGLRGCHRACQFFRLLHVLLKGCKGFCAEEEQDSTRQTL